MRLQVESNHKARTLLKTLVDRDEVTTQGVAYHVAHREMDDNPLSYAITFDNFFIYFETQDERQLCFQGPFDWLSDVAYSFHSIQVTGDVAFKVCDKSYVLQSSIENTIEKRSISIHYSRTNPTIFYSPEMYSAEPDGHTRFGYVMSRVFIGVITCPLLFFISQLLWYPLVGAPPSRIVGRCIEFLDNKQTYFEESALLEAIKRKRKQLSRAE